MNRAGVGSVAAVAAAAVVSVASPVAAAPVEHEQFHDEFQVVEEEFCGVEGLTVEHDVVVDGRAAFYQHGPDGLAYYKEHITVSTVTTNPETEAWVRVEDRVVDKDLDVTDNGDGTLTILVLATGNSVVYDSDGRAIARNPGQVRFELLIDHGGTPSDPSDDEFLEFLGEVKGSTGRSDDYCTAVLGEIT